MNRMTRSSLTIMLTSFVLVSISYAQNFPVTPASPTEFKRRNLGGTLGSAVTGVRQVKPKTVTIQYIAVSDKRTFVSTEGKKVTAHLLAFEDGGAAPSEAPLTLIKEGKIRLLVDGNTKPNVLPLTRLRPEDQAFVKALEKAQLAALKGSSEEGE